LDVEEKLSHGSGDGAFVRFAPGEKAFDVAVDNRVVTSGSVGGHVENPSDF